MVKQMMDDSIKISIIVPIYKVEKYIGDCLTSLSKQTYKNIEIILVDDGSPDNSGYIIDQFAKNRQDTIVIHQENSGVSVARNTGLENASGQYILFVDPDDYLEHDCCEKLADAALHNDDNVIFFMDKSINELTGKVIERDVGVSHKLDKSDIEYIQFNNIGMNYRVAGFHSGTPWCKLFNRDFLIKNDLRFTPGVVKAQDVLFCTQAYELLDTAYYLSYSGYVYRINEGSSNIRFNPKIVEGTKLLIEGLGEVADKHKGNRSFETSMARVCLKRVNFIERLYLFNTNKQVSKNEALRIYKEYLNIPAVEKYMRFYKSSISDGAGDRIRAILFRKNTIGLYYSIVRRRYAKGQNI